ncbi:hypothetical protein ANN_09247 [Periplaneta americana]|uniref:Uncharacterized protein n=1 Tax=Periplaneta americana TaxID=6978 RepID=A0ABQ8TN13_PERAM|nr:hypothetical protein ANN_09247 [Periplaneta americana]
MSPGSNTESYPAFAHIGLRENLGKNLNQSLILAGNEFQSLGRAIVKEDEYEEVRWDGIVSIVSWRECVFRLWWEESLSQPIASRDGGNVIIFTNIAYKTYKQIMSALKFRFVVAGKGESGNAYRLLVGRPEGKRSLGRPRRRWEDNIKMDLTKVGYDDRDWINLAQDRDRWLGYVWRQ